MDAQEQSQSQSPQPADDLIPPQESTPERPPLTLKQKGRPVSARTSRPPLVKLRLDGADQQGQEQKEELPLGQKKRAGSLKAARTRPFGGKLRIDVEAAELAAPPVVGSPLGYYSSKKLPSNTHEAHPVSLFAAENHVGGGLLSSVSPFLEYGMVVSLVCDDRAGLVAAEGFASRDVRLEKLNSNTETPMTRLGLGGLEEQRYFEEGGSRLLTCPFRDCLFEIVPKMTYDATIALKSLVEDSGQSPKRTSNQHTMGNLRFKSEAESRLNAMMYKKLKGTQVIYGQTIQLRHMKSGKYVSLDPSPMSFRGSEYAPVFLDTGGPSSHFNVLPRFKLRSKGAPVQFTDQMILTGGTEVQPYNLFVSNRNTTDGISVGVVGSSVHSSQWRAVYYDRLDEESFIESDDVAVPMRNDDGLRAGACVRLFHLESSSWLSFNSMGALESYTGIVTLQYSDENDQEDGTKRSLSSDSLWEVERVSVYEGGQIKWREIITLRHLLTGKYLAVAHQQSPRAITRPGAATRLSSHPCAQAISQEQPQAFRFMPTAIADVETQIENGDVVLIQHQKTNSFIHSIDTHASTMADIRLSAKPLSNDTSSGGNGTSSGASFTVVALHGARDEDAFKVMSVPQSEVTDTLLLVSYKNALKLFLNQFDVGLLSGEYPCFRFDSEDTVIVFRRVERVLAELIAFCVRAEDNSIDQLRSRQSLFRTHQYIELLIKMIKAPFQSYGGPFSIEDVCSYNEDYMESSQDPGDDKDELEMRGSPVRVKTDSAIAYWGSDSSNARGLISPRRSISGQDNTRRRKSTGSGSAPSSRLENHAVAMQSLNRVIPAINALLLHISWSNRANELYVVKIAMPVLMELLGNGFQTSLPLSYLLRENRNLVESISAYAGIIRNFFELIATRSKSIRYMQFLVALCTSRGKGVPKTQEAICDMLFNPANGYRDDVVIPIRPSMNGFEICTSPHPSSSGMNQDIEIMFNRSAKIKEADSDNGKWVSLARFYKEYYVNGKHRALGQYCYGLFRLYVSLCLDRNYVSIEYIQTAFPRENILKAVMDPCLSRSLRAVMMDLLRVAYVDCEPQKAMSCPNYTRIWTDIATSAAKGIPSLSNAGYSPEDLDFFAALKAFCCSYFDRLQGAIMIDEIPENELTLSIIRVSRKLVEFGMHDTEEELARLVVQLLDLLDERTDFVREPPEVEDVNYFQQNKKRGNYSPASLLLPSILRSRPGSSPLNAQASLRSTLSSVSPQQKLSAGSSGRDRRGGWGIAAQPPTQLQNSVLFDGAGAMSSIRISKERDASKQYADDGSQDCASGASSSFTVNADNTPHRHINRLLMHKPEVHAACSVNVHDMNEVNRVVMEIKDEICAILLIVDQIRLDFLISTLLASFQARHGGPPSPHHRDQDAIHAALFEDAIVRETVSSAFVASSRGLDLLPHGHNHPDKISPLATYLFGSKSLECKLSLARLGQRAVTTIFMQMLMYEYPPLVSKALELLLQQYNQHDQFLKEMQNVQLLVTEETITTYNKLKGDVDELRRLAETTEVWMDLTSRSDFERATSVCQLLKSLVNIIEQVNAGDSVNEESKQCGPRRKLELRPPGKLTHGAESSEEEPDSAADLLATNSKCAPKAMLLTENNIRKLTQRFSIEKQPPNRKLKQKNDRYVLNSSIGRVSRYSNSHEVLHPLVDPKLDLTNKYMVMKADSKDDGQTIATEARRLLRNLRAAQFVLSMLIDGAHFYEGHVLHDTEEKNQIPLHSPGSPTTRSRTKLQKRQQDQIRAVFGQGMQFLRTFCMGDAANQALVAPHATMIAHYVNELPVAQELLVAIYADNFPLYKAVPTDLINTFVRRLINDGPDPRFLFFLETIVLCNEQPIVENQLLVLFQLVKSLENATVLQLFDDASQTVDLLGGLLQRHAYLVNGMAKCDRQSKLQASGTKYSSTRNNVVATSPHISKTEITKRQYDNCSAADTGKMLEYHVRLLHLFAACATGKNTRVQEICQQILPLLSVLDLLGHDDCIEGVQFALLRFLDQVFFTADDIELPGVDDLVPTMMVLSQVCERRVIQHLRYIQVKDLNRQATLSLRKNKSKVGKMLGLSAQKPTESPPLYLVLFSIVPTLHSFLQQFPNLFDSSGEAQYHLLRFQTCVALLLAVCATSKWQLPEDAVSNFEEFVYVIDKFVRPNMLQYQTTSQISLEQAWSTSFKYLERLDCSSINCELELADILKWALDKRDRELQLHSPQNTGLDEVNGYGLTKISSQDDALTPIIAGESTSSGDNLSNNRDSLAGNDAGTEESTVAATSSTKLDTINTTKPIAWGSKGSTQTHQQKNSLLLKQSPSFSNTVRAPSAVETVATSKNNGRLLHRLSPKRYFKALRSGKGEGSDSPKKESSVTPLFGLNLPDRYRAYDALGANGVQQNEGSYFYGHQQQHFNELDQFLNWLQTHPRVHGAMRDELNQMVQGILSIETSMKEEFNPHAHIRNVCLSFDLVVAKLVAHVEALQDSSYLKTNLMLLNVFSRMIYAIEDAEERHNMQIKMNQLGVTRLVVQLVSSRDNDALFASSIEVGVALLDGMNAEVQESFYGYWTELVNELFFERIQERIERAAKLIHSVDRASANSLSIYREDNNVDEPFDSHGAVNDKTKLHQRQSMFGLDLDSAHANKSTRVAIGAVKKLGAPITPIFRFLQLLCEGHFLNAQRALIAQPHATVSANLVETTTSFLLDTYLALTDLDMGLITQLFETITEYCQGPCVEAQETVANYKFISAVNALMTHTFEQRDARTQFEVRQLRAAIVITLLSLLEGRSDRVLHTQLVQELNFEALKMNLVEVYSHFLRKFETYAGNSKCSQDFYLTMGFNIYILLQQLADQHPQHAWWIPSTESEELLASNLPHTVHSAMHVVSGAESSNSPDYRDAFYFFQSNCAKVEVVWDHRRSPAVFIPDQLTTRASIALSGNPESASTFSASGAAKSLSSDVGTSNTGTLIPFYFPVHPICFCLTQKSKKKLVWDVSRGADKLSDFYTRSDKLVDEMTHQSRLQRHHHVSRVATKAEQIKRLSFSLAVVINLIVMLFYRAGGIDSKPYAESQVTFIHTWGSVADPPPPSLWIDGAVSLAGTLLIFLYCLVLGCYLLNSAPLLIKKGWKRRHRREQAKRSKRSAHSSQHRPAEHKERESLQDTENLLRSLREREEEYNYLFLPPSISKRYAQAGIDTISPRVTASVFPVDFTSTNSTRISGKNDILSGRGLLRGQLRFQIETVCTSFYFLVRSPRVIYSLLQIFIAILGSYVNKLYFAFLLLDVVDRYKELNNVLRSITRPAKALGVTTLLYLIVVYVFAVVGFFFFREDYTPSGNLTEDQREGREPYACQRLFQCFLVSLDQGLKSDGGLGSYLQQLPLGGTIHSYGRLVFDVLFNIFLVVLLLNLVFGVIIDTFASLRTDDQEKKMDMQGRCFICSIDAYTFDRATKRGFHDHISRDHNMWHYLYLFVHIRKKRITEYNGLELFLAMRMAKKDVSFFPTHRALSLTKRGDLEEDEADLGSHDDRFYAASSGHGSKRYGMTPFSPRTSLGSPSRRGSEQRRVQTRNKHKSSPFSFHATPESRSVGYFDGAMSSGVQAIDRSTVGKLERIEATIATLASVQTEMKEAQRRAEERYTEILAAISGDQQAFGQYPTASSVSGRSVSGSPPAVSRHPSIRTAGSVTPRIFNFESVTDGLEFEVETGLVNKQQATPSFSPEDNASNVSTPVVSPQSVRPSESMTPQIFSVNSEENDKDRLEFLDAPQSIKLSWPELDLPPVVSPQNFTRLQNPNSSLTFHYESNEMSDDSSSSSESLAECSPGLTNSILLQTRSPRMSPSRKPGVVTRPGTFNFEFDSSDEEHKEESPRFRKR